MIRELRITVDAVTDDGVLSETFLRKTSEDPVDTITRFDNWIERRLGISFEDEEEKEEKQ